MSETKSNRWTTVVTVIGVLMVLEAITFLLAAMLHLGIQFPLGFSEPQIIPDTIVEGLCGIFLGGRCLRCVRPQDMGLARSCRGACLCSGGRPFGDHCTRFGRWPKHASEHDLS